VPEGIATDNDQAVRVRWDVGQEGSMQSGFGMGIDVPVSVRIPDRWSTLKRLTVLLASLVTNSHGPAPVRREAPRRLTHASRMS
jgi:hypothetical protein